LNPSNRPSGYASGFHIVQKTRVRCAQAYVALPCALGLLLKFKSYHRNSHLTSIFIDEINTA